MSKIPTRNYVEHYDSAKAHHRAWLQAVLDRLEELDPAALQDGSALRDLWKAAVETKAPLTSQDPPWLPLALAIIREFEGCRLEAYQCSSGVWTIGWGATQTPSGGPVRSGDRLTQLQADALLESTVRELFGPGVAFLIAPWKRLTPGAQAALTSFAFNVGLGAVEGSTLRRRLNAGEDPNTVARAELPRWNKDANGVSAGLVRRRDAEVALFTGKAPAPAIQQSIPSLIGPRATPASHGFIAGDHHFVMNDQTEELKAYNFSGRLLWTIPALARGQGGDAEWKCTGTDTPPGLYRCGKVYRDIDAAGSMPSPTAERLGYGWYSIDMEGLEGQEGPGSTWGRDGVMIHGGGTACGWPGAWAAKQALYPTLGCIRCHNIDLRDKIMPIIDGPGEVFVSVFQERK